MEEIKDLELTKSKIITIEDFFGDKQKIILNDRKLELFLNGVKVDFKLNDGVYRIFNEQGIFIGLGEIKQEKLKRDVII